MIEKLEDLELSHDDEMETIEKKIQDKLGISVNEMRQALSAWTMEHAEELTQDFVNMAPLGDYSKLLEDNDSMAEFLKAEAHKPEHWMLYSVRTSDANKALLSFDFKNDAVDDGDIFSGFVFVSLSGKIRHAFAQGES
jgi:hypothetical protein